MKDVLAGVLMIGVIAGALAGTLTHELVQGLIAMLGGDGSRIATILGLGVGVFAAAYAMLKALGLR